MTCLQYVRKQGLVDLLTLSLSPQLHVTDKEKCSLKMVPTLCRIRLFFWSASAHATIDRWYTVYHNLW